MSKRSHLIEGVTVKRIWKDGRWHAVWPDSPLLPPPTDANIVSMRNASGDVSRIRFVDQGSQPYQGTGRGILWVQPPDDD